MPRDAISSHVLYTYIRILSRFFGIISLSRLCARVVILIKMFSIQFSTCVYLLLLYTCSFSLSLFLKLHSPLFITGCTSGCICAIYIIAHIIHMHTTAVTLNKCFKWFAPRIPVALMYAAHAPSSTQNANVVPQNPIFSFLLLLLFLLCLSTLSLF